MGEHTPLPWHYFYAGSGLHEIYAENGTLIASVQSGCDDEAPSDDMCECNMMFIVSAANSHGVKKDA